MEASAQPPCSLEEARRAALKIGFGEPLSPLSFESMSDEQILPDVKLLAPDASRTECLAAIALVRRLCGLVCAFADIYYEGGFGEGRDGRKAAIRELAARIPGFSYADYEAAFSAGLIWMAF